MNKKERAKDLLPFSIFPPDHAVMVNTDMIHDPDFQKLTTEEVGHAFERAMMFQGGPLQKFVRLATKEDGIQ